MSPEPPGPVPAGVIHDIGYRHYAGPRLPPARAAGALFQDGLRGAFGLGRSTRSKVVPLLLLAATCLPALVVVIVANVSGSDTLGVRYPDYAVVTFPVISLFVAGQAPVSVSRDLRFRIVSLYFSRPLSRAQYVRAKYAALTAAVLVLSGLPLLFLYAGALLAGLPVWAQTRGLLQGLLGIVLLAVLLAGVALVIASVTPRRGLGVAAVLVVLVMVHAVQGTLQALGAAQGDEALEVYSRLLAPAAAVDGVLIWLFGTGDASVVRPDAVQGLVLAAGCVVTAAGCYLLLLLRYRRVSVS